MKKKTGIELIAEERQEQLTKHGRTIERDIEENPMGELMQGAIACLKGLENNFPISWDNNFTQNVVRKPIEQRLIIAGALIAAEIDRLNNIK